MTSLQRVAGSIIATILLLCPAAAQHVPDVAKAAAVTKEDPQPAALPNGKPGETKSARIERLSGVWIEGPGYDIKYGATYEVCAQRCLATPKCAMIEYYRPEKKCNLYDKVRPRVAGGSSDVGLRR
jgi:hypothetical protein